MACGDIWARDSSPGLSASRRQQIRLSRLGQRRAGWPEQLLQWGGRGVPCSALTTSGQHATTRSTPPHGPRRTSLLPPRWSTADACPSRYFMGVLVWEHFGCGAVVLDVVRCLFQSNVNSYVCRRGCPEGKASFTCGCPLEQAGEQRRATDKTGNSCCANSRL